MRKVIATVDVVVKIVEEEEDGQRHTIKKIPAFSTVKEFPVEDVGRIFEGKHLQATLFQALADQAEGGGASISIQRHLDSEAKRIMPPKSGKNFFDMVRLKAIEGLSEKEAEAFDIWWHGGTLDWDEFIKQHSEAYSAILWTWGKGVDVG